MAKSDPTQDAQVVLARLESMGVRARLMDGGRSVVAKMRLQSTSFESPVGSLHIEEVVFSCIGRDRIKCLKPHALFALPMIRTLDCRDSTEIEARIRIAWRTHVAQLSETRAWLDMIGARSEFDEESALLALRIEGEGRGARAVFADPQRVILPSRGALSGITLSRLEDRCLGIDRSTRSGVELEIAVSTRIEEVQRVERRLAEDRRRLEASRQPRPAAETHRTVRQVPLLLVGPWISQQTAVIESLRLRGYDVALARSESEGLAAFDSHSPELILADMAMGRSEGTSFVLALRRIAGIEDLPVVLVDATRREPSREAARRVGAAGYLVRPIEVQRIAGKLEQMVEEPHRRRFTRYEKRLPVVVRDARHPCMVTMLGRGGMFVATEDDFPTETVHECHVSLPELGTTVACDAEVRYRRGTTGMARGGVGVRFHRFHGSDENVLIEYLQGIGQATLPG